LLIHRHKYQSEASKKRSFDIGTSEIRQGL